MISKKKNAFTLLETLLAISVVAILLTSFLAVFGPATNGIRRAISIDDADRLAGVLERELSTIQANEEGQFDTAFEKAFDWVANSDSLDSSILLFQYRGDPTQITDGIPETFTGSDGLVGQDFVLTPTARKLGSDDGELERLMEAIEGRAFVARMRQLVRNDDGSLIAESTGGSLTSQDGQTASSSDEFEDAVIVFQTDFYVLPASSFQYVSNQLTSGGQDFENVLGQPVFSRNMAARR